MPVFCVLLIKKVLDPDPIDLDDLKHDYLKTWEDEKQRLESYANKHSIKIIWFLDKLEEELSRVLGENYKGQAVIRNAKNNTKKFINSKLWHRILDTISERENDLAQRGGRFHKPSSNCMS